MSAVQRPAANSDARKRAELADTLEESLARFFHADWCSLESKCSYGGDDYAQAEVIAEVVRQHVAAGGSL